MILDSSVLVALALREPGVERLIEAIAAADRAAIGAANLLEAGIVLSARLQQDARGLLARLLAEGGIRVLPVTDAHFGIAMEAWLRFGEGRHPAALNFGDCVSYAMAIVSGEPLLAVGDGLRLTDCPLA